MIISHLQIGLFTLSVKLERLLEVASEVAYVPPTLNMVMRVMMMSMMTTMINGDDDGGDNDDDEHVLEFHFSLVLILFT